jgi:hypothetical protein
MTEAAQAFSARAAVYAKQGYAGPDIFERLAVDTKLPPFFTQFDVCAIEGVKLETLRARRRRGQAPVFLKIGGCLRTPRDTYCRYLAAHFIANGYGKTTQKIAADS